MTMPAENAKIVSDDETLKIEQTVALPEIENGMEQGLRKLEADHEASANEPVQLSPGSPPVLLSLGDLEKTEEAQRNGLDRIVEIVRRTEQAVTEVNRDLRDDLIAQQRRQIREAALKEASTFFGEMAGRSMKAEAGREFFERRSVLLRAKFPGSEMEHAATTSSWVLRLGACPPFTLVQVARMAAASGNAALGALAFEAALGRPDVSDAERHGVQDALMTLKLPESDKALSLIASISNAEKAAGIQMLKLNPTRLDALTKSGRSKIALGLDQRGRPGRGAFVQ